MSRSSNTLRSHACSTAAPAAVAGTSRPTCLVTRSIPLLSKVASSSRIRGRFAATAERAHKAVQQLSELLMGEPVEVVPRQDLPEVPDSIQERFKRRSDLTQV